MKEQHQQEWKLHLCRLGMKHGDKGSGRKEVQCVVRRAGSQRSIFRVQRILGVGVFWGGEQGQPLEVVQKGPHLLQAMLLEHHLLHRTCEGMEEVLDGAGKGSIGLCPVWAGFTGRAPKAPVSITPCCFLLGVSCCSTKSLLKQGGAETIWESKYFLITVSNKLLFAVNGRKWEKPVVAITQHRLYCWKRDLVHRFL